jgi:hypothetical protein
MTQQTAIGDDGGGPTTSRPLKDRIEQERSDARATVESVRDDVSEKASRLASDAKAAAEERLEEAQHGIGSGLKSIGGALRAAGDHLSDEHQATAARIASDAATGLERLSDTLQNRSLDEVVGELRAFGRRNAGGLFAGSLLAGLAVGRLMKLSGTNRATGSGATRQPAGGDADASAETRRAGAPMTDPARPAPGRAGTPVSPAVATPGASPAPSMTPGAPAGATGTVPAATPSPASPGGTR